MAAPRPTPIYHITDLNILPGIVGSGGLLCCATLQQRSVQYHDIANDDIQDKRSRTMVPCRPGGRVHDYVPFYFAPRSPMLYVVHMGRNGPRYPRGQLPVVHLVSTVQAVYASNRPAVFTNGHAIMALSEFFTDPADLDQIDWAVMGSRWWNDTQEQPGRKRRRQAEFLVQHLFPWSLVSEIGVINRAVAAQVESLIRLATHQPPVVVRGNWYYGG